MKNMKELKLFQIYYRLGNGKSAETILQADSDFDAERILYKYLSKYNIVDFIIRAKGSDEILARMYHPQDPARSVA